MVQQMTRIVRSEAPTVPFFHICAPEEGTRTQLIQIFVQYATRHPELYHEDFWRVAHAALREAFPCKQ